MFEFFHKRPYVIYSVMTALVFIGIYGLIAMPKNLFPDVERPTVVIITKMPGATAGVVTNLVSKPIEEEVARLALVRKVSSTNMANFSIVKAEFEYAKGLNAAAVDVSNALSIVKSKLPANASPAIYTTGAFTLPVEVITLTPKSKALSLGDIRKVADSFIKPYLLSNPAIGNVEVFGGYSSAITIEIDPVKAAKYHVNLNTLTKTLAATNKNLPLGFVKGENGFFTLTYYGEKEQVETLRRLQIMPNLYLEDIARVKWTHDKRFSGYIGNSKEGIALAVQRAPGGSVLGVSKIARKEMKKLEGEYKNIHFEISDTQRDLVETSNTNMLEALRDAIIYTLIVLMFFLGNFRAVLTVGFSIPIVFFGTMTVLVLFGQELNIVVYTAIILSLGLLIDDAVVIIENIERHMSKLGEKPDVAVISGTKEVLLPDFAGTLSTTVILAPLMFVGGFPEHIFRPLISTLLIALFMSYLLSVTFIPHFAKYLYRNGVTEKNSVEKFFDTLYSKTLGRLIAPYVAILSFSNGKHSFARKLLLTFGILFVLALSVKNIMPLIGRDVMPPMDTGIVKIVAKFSANDTVEEATKELQPFLNWLKTQKEVKMSSVAFGSEAGVLSLGSGNLPSEASITINYVNRFERKETIWQLEEKLREQLHKLKGLKSADVFDFGATAISSIKAPLDVRLRSGSYENLPQKAAEVTEKIKDIKGLTSISTSWSKDFMEANVKIDTNKALKYGLTPVSIAMQLPVKGEITSLNGGLASMNVQPMRLYLGKKYGNNIEALRRFPLQTKKGEIPLSAVATIEYDLSAAKIERDKMLYSIDVNAYRSTRPVSQITDDANARLKSVDLSGVLLSQEGDIAEIHDSTKRILKAIAIGIVLDTLLMIVIFRSVTLAMMMIFILPLTMIGAAWGMMLFGKPSSMPSMVGILLLFGIVINNTIIVADFYRKYREKDGPFESAMETIRIRFRPVMMTTFGTIAGMIPIALEQAVGLERLSPLADVAIGGMIVGSFLTLVYLPMYAYGFDRGKKKLKSNDDVAEVLPL